MKKKIVFAVVLSVLCLGVVAPASAGLLEFFFPSLREKGPDPMDTLQAPFALDPKAKPPAERPDPRNAKLPENHIAMSLPHRSSREIGSWLVSVLSESMTYDKGNYDASFNEIQKYFTPEGKAQYIKFLEDNSMMQVLKSGKYTMRAIVQETPLLLNEGALNGTYKWLFEVPVMVSYLEVGAGDYKEKRRSL